MCAALHWSWYKKSVFEKTLIPLFDAEINKLELSFAVSLHRTHD